MKLDYLWSALCVMGVEAGTAWARRRDVAAVFVWQDTAGLKIRRTEAFERMVVEDGSWRPQGAVAADGGN